MNKSSKILAVFQTESVSKEFFDTLLYMMKISDGKNRQKSGNVWIHMLMLVLSNYRFLQPLFRAVQDMAKCTCILNFG